jgi:hypothetical protein
VDIVTSSEHIADGRRLETATHLRRRRMVQICIDQNGSQPVGCQRGGEIHSNHRRANAGLAARHDDQLGRWFITDARLATCPQGETAEF